MPPMSVRLATAEDRPAILDLLRSAQEDAVPEGKRAEQGFLPGEWDEEALEACSGGPGIFLAEDKNKLAGVVLTSEGAARPGPAQRTEELTKSLDGPVLHWGPVVVAPKYRGKGVVRMLLSGMALMLGERYPSAALYVENTNQRALKVHRALGVKKHTTFTLDDRTYTVFTFAPGDFKPKPAK
ncbi:GNAT family N-acetyltransferase [Saccharopolyspora rhizosphaerae]|uniref:GNAT family N-acetyltransferase n=1 Tax=Saccharopolyspora rhizosphaerae TaxID=2492662 RepID=A0A3R8P521_9PSEU|nr:GNAT family N-acetyltransferase [Saccharopolyspora rhizosphaerae]RRO16684.1 GNAT family N-acetyltransferase [Saccharopolyspora rhizosphaerae]